MTSTNLYGDLLASLLRFCGNFSTKLKVKTGQPFQAVFFDSYQDYEELPSGNLIGVAQYALDIDEHITTVSAVVGIATMDDTNDFLLGEAMGLLVQQLLPTKGIEVVDATTGSRLGDMRIQTGVRVLPAGGGAGRSMKWIAFMATSTVTADLDA